MPTSATTRIAAQPSLERPQAGSSGATPSNIGAAGDTSPFAALLETSAPPPQPKGSRDNASTDESKNAGSVAADATITGQTGSANTSAAGTVAQTDASATGQLTDTPSTKSDKNVSDKGKKTDEPQTQIASPAIAATAQLVATVPITIPTPTQGSVQADSRTDNSALGAIAGQGTASPTTAPASSAIASLGTPAQAANTDTNSVANDDPATAAVGATQSLAQLAASARSIGKSDAGKLSKTSFTSADAVKSGENYSGKGPDSTTAAAASDTTNVAANDDTKPNAEQSPTATVQSEPSASGNLQIQTVASAGQTTTPSSGTAQAGPAGNVQVTARADASAPNIPALAVEVVAKSQSGAKQFDIRLDPPDLGRVEIRLSIDQSGKTSAHLSADQPQTLDLLRKDSPTLTQALRDAGLDVSQNGLNFSLRKEFAGNGGGGNGRNNSRVAKLSATLNIEATGAANFGQSNGQLDITV